jgi:transcriptional regulator with XRE-family HTH domain
MSEGLGPRLREARLRRGLSVRALAQGAGVSAGFISQVEGGRTQPSVATLYAVGSVLEVSLDELLGIEDGGARAVARSPGPVAGPVQRAGDNPVLQMAEGVTWERLASPAHRGIQALLVTYQPGARSSTDGRLMRHNGFEHAYVTEGEITLVLEFDTFVVGRGDSVSFEATRPHLVRNDGRVPARGVWFVVENVVQNVVENPSA